MPQIIKHSQHSKYFILYCISMVLHGLNMIGLGSYIPYLSQETGVIETSYSFLFSCRSFGMLAGAALIKILQKKDLTNHGLLIAGTLMIGLFTFLFSFTTSSLWLGVWLFLASIGYSVFEVKLNVCLLLISPSEQVQYWMLIGHGAFGVGGILSPIFVYIFELKAYFVFGILILLLIPVLFKMESPQLCGLIPEHKPCPIMRAKSISTTLQCILALFIFLYVGMECTYGGWIPSYAVLTGVTDPQGATKFPSLFWVLLTMFRFLLAYAPGSSSKKLRLLIQGNFYTGIISLFLIFAGFNTLACYISGVLFGLSMSSIYPLVFTFPIEEGLIIENSQATNIGIAGVVSEGVLVMIVGKMMEWIHINMLFYSLTVCAVILWLLRFYSLCLIENQKKKIQNGDISIELLPKDPSMF